MSHATRSSTRIENGKPRITTDGYRRGRTVSLLILLGAAALSAALAGSRTAYAAEIVLQLPYSTVVESVRVSGDRVVWSDASSGSKDVFLYDLATKERHTISAEAGDQDFPQIWGDRVAWTDTRDGTRQVYVHDLATGTEWRASTSPADLIQVSLWDDWIAWIEGGRPMLYRISDRALFPMLKEFVNEQDTEPIVRDGWLVVHRQGYGGLPQDLLAYDLSSPGLPLVWAPRNITNGSPWVGTWST